jgi:hypothetical protein
MALFKRLLFLLTAVAAGVVAKPDTAPIGIPVVRGVDQSPSVDPSQYGRCSHRIEPPAARATSHWCAFGRLGSWPEFPNAAARRSFKFGRLTTYTGPILRQRLACNVSGAGSDAYATLAVSTKYLKPHQGGWAADAGACWKCACVSLFGGDDAYNRGLRRSRVLAMRGLSFMARVGDRMGEGADESIDVLLDRPFAYAYQDADGNPNAAKVNALPGPRGFPWPSSSDAAAYPTDVGTWTALWQFVPCGGGWTHARCATAVAELTGYRTRAPGWTPGLRAP